MKPLGNLVRAPSHGSREAGPEREARAERRPRQRRWPDWREGSALAHAVSEQRQRFRRAENALTNAADSHSNEEEGMKKMMTRNASGATAKPPGVNRTSHHREARELVAAHEKTRETAQPRRDPARAQSASEARASERGEAKRDDDEERRRVK